MFLFSASPSIHETVFSAKIRAEDRANVRGSVDSRVVGMGPVGGLEAALGEIRTAIRTTGQQRDLYRIEFAYEQAGRPTECQIAIGKSSVLHVTTVTFIATIGVRVSGAVEFDFARPNGPGFRSTVAPFLAEALNQSAPVLRTATAMLNRRYRVGQVTVEIEPKLSLTPAAPTTTTPAALPASRSARHSDTSAFAASQLRVVTTLRRGPAGIGYSLGVKDFARLRDVFERELS